MPYRGTRTRSTALHRYGLCFILLLAGALGTVALSGGATILPHFPPHLVAVADKGRSRGSGEEPTSNLIY